MRAAIYLHFPFCIRKCRYCDFCSAPGTEEEINRYLHCLCEEIRQTAAIFPDVTADTLFLGGGTPSLIPFHKMKEVIQTLHDCFQFSQNCEFTSEANPGTITSEWLDGMVSLGMNRLSIGAQAVQNDLLLRIGRIHRAEEIFASVNAAHKSGIVNINLDTMYGLPSQRPQDYLETLTACIQTGVTHISSYSLILEEGTALYHDVLNKKETLPDEDCIYDMESSGRELLKRNGFTRYEISNYAKDGFRCRHNISYWQDGWYIGLGMSAHSMLPPTQPGSCRLRTSNTSNYHNYCSCLENTQQLPREEINHISSREARFETMMLSTRMTEGISEKHFIQIHGISLEECWGTLLLELTEQGLAVWNTDSEGERSFVLTERGLSVQNAVLLRFLEKE